MAHARKCCNTLGFTLVELLVCIGIIAILLSLLLPTINGARQQATAVKCSSTLRLFGQSWMQYNNADHGTCVPGRLPTGGAPGGLFDIGPNLEYRPRWFELLGAEMGQIANLHPTQIEDDKWLISNPVFLCPAMLEFNNSRNYPYGYNHQFLGNARPVMSGQKAYIAYPINSSQIAGAQTVLAADCLGTAAGKAKLDRTAYDITGGHNVFAILNKGYLLDPPRMTPTSDYDDDLYRQPSDRSGPDARHRNKCNVLFCDGHVSAMTPQDMGYSVLADGSMPITGNGANNRLFSGKGTDLDPPSIIGQ